MKRMTSLRQSVAVSAVLMAILFVLPLTVIVPFRSELFSSEERAAQSQKDPFVPGELDGETVLKVLDGDEVREMTVGEYLVGVVRAEMPASFEEEALKAQAVAARTYTYYKIQTGGNHGDTADICTDSTCCQAYIGEEQARSNWGADADENESKIEAAVRDTDGQVILYGGVPILAVFHSSSAGMTRAAGQVWLNDLPYLQSVTSPEQGNSIPNYYSRAEFTQKQFREKVLAAEPEADLSGPVETWLQNAVTDTAGRVSTVDVGGVTVKDGKLVFFVTGYGHGVGMSQYGAQQMAKDGADYLEILTHYYTGVTVEAYVPDALQR